MGEQRPFAHAAILRIALDVAAQERRTGDRPVLRDVLTVNHLVLIFVRDLHCANGVHLAPNGAKELGNEDDWRQIVALFSKTGRQQLASDLPVW